MKPPNLNVISIIIYHKKTVNYILSLYSSFIITILYKNALFRLLLLHNNKKTTYKIAFYDLLQIYS